MGAFLLAARTGLPVVPVGIRGARSILRDVTWFPRFGAVTVAIGAPVAPAGGDWTDAVRLRDQVRAEILRLSLESDRLN
jgi:1-acyl-sn-glycerol-3-phosphate acyltransferase